MDFPVRSAELVENSEAKSARGEALGPVDGEFDGQLQDRQEFDVPSGELTFCHGKSPFLMGKSTI